MRKHWDRIGWMRKQACLEYGNSGWMKTKNVKWGVGELRGTKSMKEKAGCGFAGHSLG
jgi:hypothetical protein